MDTSTIKLPIHRHPLYHSARFHGRCEGCSSREEGIYYGGYRCNDSDCTGVSFHKKCAELPLVINHLSHPEHPLQLIESPPRNECDMCGNNIFVEFPYLYHCSTCDFNIDTSCARKSPLPLTIEHPNPNELPFLFSKERERYAHCGVCGQTVYGRYHYGRASCDVYVHMECIYRDEKVNLPFHPSHSLEFTTFESLSHEAKKACVLCGVRLELVSYYCSICDFSICLGCVKSPRPLVIEHSRTHEDQLTLLSRRILFTCNVCGIREDDQCSYLCLECGFMVHRSCIDLPHVIIINRHDHRISRTNHLGIGFSACGVCRRPVNQFHGAYTCSICPKYAVHSQCATSYKVWDGIELEGVPEEIEVLPFKVVGDNLINHFSHEEHNLKFSNGNIVYDVDSRCEACVSPLYSDPIYSCEKCIFYLHERCAHLPMKRRHVSSNRPFTLHARGDDPQHNWFMCSTCDKPSTGFRYISDYSTLDVHCSLVSEPFVHDGHTHPLYYKDNVSSTCNSCHKKLTEYDKVLGCDVFDFNLDFYCANMPKIVKHKYDRHPLSLRYSEEASGKYWCDICETVLDPSKWFYLCADCGVTLHVECVFGDFSHFLTGTTIKTLTKDSYTFEVVPTKDTTRQLCNQCHFRCKTPFNLKALNQTDDMCICSFSCVRSFNH